MSRIDQITPGQGPRTGQTGKTGQAAGGESFQSMLDKAAQTGQATETASAQGLQAPPASQAVSASGQVAPTAPVDQVAALQTQGLLHAGRTLDLLDTYAQALAQEQKPLKEVSGLVKNLEGEVGQLNQVLGQMDPKDGLYGLLQQVAVTAMVETVKFNRGDYLPQEPAEA